MSSQYRTSDKVFIITLIKNNFVIYLEKIFKITSGVFITAMMARYLGPDEFGKWSYALLIFSFFQSVVTLGIESILVRELILRPNEVYSLLSNSIIGRLVIGGVSIILVTLLGYALDMNSLEYFYILLIMSLSYLFQPLDSIESYFQVSNKIKYTTIAKIAAYSLSLGIKLHFLNISVPLYYFSFANMFEVFVANYLIFNFFIKIEDQFTFKFDSHILKKLISDSKYFLLSSISIFVYMRIDQFLILNFLGEKKLGIFMAAFSLVSMFHLVPVVMSTSVMPYFSAAMQRDYNLYLRHLTLLFRFMFILSFLIIVSVSIFSEFLIVHIFGEQYMETLLILKILILSILPIFIGVIQSIHIILHKQNNLILLRTFMGGSLAVLLNIIFLHVWELSGSAYASVITQFLIVYVSPYFYDRKLAWMQFGIIKKESHKL